MDQKAERIYRLTARGNFLGLPLFTKYGDY